MASGFDPLSLIASPITGAFQYAGAKEQADAQKQAAALQSQYAQEALDFTKGQKAKQEASAAPYLAVGQQAVGALPGAVRPMPTGAPPSPYAVAPGGSSMGQQTGYSTLSMANAPSAYGMAPSASANGVPAGSTAVQMVRLQAPDGSVRQVPSNLVQPFIAKGAKVLS
jgi:hypothetical protein